MRCDWLVGVAFSLSGLIGTVVVASAWAGRTDTATAGRFVSVLAVIGAGAEEPSLDPWGAAGPSRASLGSDPPTLPDPATLPDRLTQPDHTPAPVTLSLLAAQLRDLLSSVAASGPRTWRRSPRHDDPFEP
jgi:hypothetical protein